MTPEEYKRELRRLNPAQLRAALWVTYRRDPEEATGALQAVVAVTPVPTPVPGQLELPC